LRKKSQKNKGGDASDEETGKGGEGERFFERIDQVSLNEEKENEEEDEGEY
jgi:hypothetical protein